MIQQGKRIKKHAYLLLISLLSIGVDVGLFFLHREFGDFAFLNLRSVVIIGFVYRVVLVSLLSKLVYNSLNKTLIEKHKLHLWMIGIFVLPEIFIWPFRYFYSMAMFEAESSPNYVTSIKTLFLKKNALKADVAPPIAYQFNSQAEKLAKLEELKDKGLIKEKEYQELKDYIMQQDETTSAVH